MAYTFGQAAQTKSQTQQIKGLYKFGDASGGQTTKEEPKKDQNPLVGLVKGAAKGFGSSAYGLADITAKVSNKLLGTELPVGEEAKPEFLKPKTKAEKIGYGAEQIAEFLVPLGLSAKAVKAGEAALATTRVGRSAKMASGLARVGKGLTTEQKLNQVIAGLGKLGIRSGVAGAETAGVTALQTGGDIDETIKAGLMGVSFPIAATALSKTSKAVFPKIANWLERTNLRLTPTQKSKLGGKIDDVTDYLSRNGYVGTPEQRFTKVSKVYNQMEDILDDFLGTHPTTKGFGVDKGSILKKVQGVKKLYKSDRDFDAISRQIDGFTDLLKNNYQNKIPLKRLNQLKRSTFKNAFNQAGDKISDTVEYEIGDILKKAIEDATKGQTILGRSIGEFNKEYGTIITAKKLLNIARGRQELGLVGKLASSAAGASIGGGLGGPLGAGAGIFAGQEAAKLAFGTPSRSAAAWILARLADIGESDGVLKTILLGGSK